MRSCICGCTFKLEFCFTVCRAMYHRCVSEKEDFRMHHNPLQNLLSPRTVVNFHFYNPIPLICIKKMSFLDLLLLCWYFGFYVSKGLLKERTLHASYVSTEISKIVWCFHSEATVWIIVNISKISHCNVCYVHVALLYLALHRPWLDTACKVGDGKSLLALWPLFAAHLLP